MLWLGASLALLFGTLISTPAQASQLVALGIALDQEEDPDDFNWAAENFVQIFKDQTASHWKSVQTPLILGKELKRKKVLQTIEHWRKQLKGDDLFILYVGTHGSTEPDTGWSVEDANEDTLTGADLKEVLGRFPCPVLTVISTCGSGGFVQDRYDGVKLPKNVMAFCACKGRLTTGNTLDQSVAEGLYGRADYNGDKIVTIGEVRRYIAQRYREWLPPGKKPTDVPELIPVLSNTEQGAADIPLTRVTRPLIAAAPRGPDGRRWYGALQLGEENGQTRVRFLGYAPATKGPYLFPDALLSREELNLPGDPPPIAVEWQGEWFAARILERKGSEYRIHYIGYPKADDETVSADRVRYLFATGPTDPAAEPPAPKPQQQTKLPQEPRKPKETNAPGELPIAGRVVREK